MSLCTVTELRAVLGIGAVYTDAQLQEVCDSADAVLLPMLWRKSVPIVAHSYSAALDQATYWCEYDITGIFYIGETVIITGNGAHFDGNHTIVSIGERSFNVTVAHVEGDRPVHALMPYGTVTGKTTTDWTADPSIQLAAQFIAVDIWQARNAAGMGSIAPDGTPMPYRLNTQLLSKVRGMIAHALAPNGMVG